MKFLRSKIIHMNGGPTVPDMTCPSFISTKSVSHGCSLRKKESLLDFIQAIKETFENCVLNNSTVCCASLLLTMRKMLSVWQEYHLTMAAHRTFRKYLTLFSLGPSRTQQGRQMVW